MGGRIHEEKRGNGWKENRLQEVQDKRTDPTCSLQRKIGNAGRDSDGTCMGFASVVSDEPMERCKRCIACTSYQWEE